MAVEITVILDGSAGGMARVITALKRLGLTFAGHHIEPAGDDRSRLTVSAEGSALGDEVRQTLSGIKGVAEIVQIGGVEVAAMPAGAPREPPRAPPARTATPGSSPAFEDLAGRIADDYPRIIRYIEAFEQTISGREELGPGLRRLGRLVGERLGEQDTVLHGARTLHEALESSVVQILDGIAEPEVIGSDIKVRLSIFTRRQVNTMDLVFGGEASRCDFLSGMIEGMIDGVAGLPDIRVQETSCRTNGDEYCIFHVSTQA
ncbi:MAG: hypothetical protein WB783_09060 [Arenicellales bacterium]